MSTTPPEITQLPPMLTPEEVAEKLRVTSRHIRNLCDRGEIPGARKVGNLWRIPASYLTGEAA